MQIMESIRRGAGEGAFERRLALPCAVDADRAEATDRSGVLTVRLPRSDDDRRERIRVGAA